MNGSQMKAFHVAVCAAFDHKNLARLVHYELDVKLARVTAKDDFESVVYDLLTYLHQKGCLEELVAVVLRERDQNAEVKHFRETYPELCGITPTPADSPPPQATEPPPTPTVAAPVEKVEPTPPGPPKTKRKPSARTTRPTKTPREKPKTRPSQAGFTGVIDTSEDWCFLDNRFLQCSSVARPDDRHFVVKVNSDRAEVDAAIKGLRPAGYSSGKPLAFAYANDAFVVQCTAVSSTQTGKRLDWQVILQKENIEYGGGLMESDIRVGGRPTQSTTSLNSVRGASCLASLRHPNPRWAKLKIG